MDCILNPKGMNVAAIKRKYNLTGDEYEMIFDLTMPKIRHKNGNDFWKNNYLTLRTQIYERLRKEEYGNELATDISNILQDHSVGRKQKKEIQIDEPASA